MRSGPDAAEPNGAGPGGAPGGGAPPGGIARRLLETTGLALVMALGFRFPADSGRGWLEAAAALLFPTLLCAFLFRGRKPGWAFLALFLGLVLIFYWVPGTIAIKAPLPYPLALLAGLLFYSYEAAGFLLVALCGRWAWRRARGSRGAAAAAVIALALLAWEILGFHIYAWSWGAPLGGLPWLARAAAFLDTHALAALLWACGAWTGANLAEGRRPRRILAGPALLALLLLGLGGLWYRLPRGPQRMLDVVMIQPDFPAGERRPGMEQDMWRRSDAELKLLGWPRAEAATLLLWPESSVLGRDDLLPNPRLAQEAQRRGIAWLFGTEGGDFNLLRGEAAGQPSFLQAKVEPMPFGERMPDPPALRRWLDRTLGFVSQEPGVLSPASSFQFPTPQGPLRVHPVICSEALLSSRVRDGLALAGGELLTNHTNDGWFERSPATDLHAAQIRLRAVEAGLPLLRATLTGKSGVFREDGSWVLWGQPMTEAAYAVQLRWRPVLTPARSPWPLRALAALLALAAAALAGAGAAHRHRS
jgi:apolipoprotein N-acyltransferase